MILNNMINLIEKIRYKILYLWHDFQCILGKRNLIYAFYWGVSINKSARFRGKCYFRKQPNSIIRIGSNFKCYSIINESGLIKRPCSIQTNFPGSKLIIGDNVGMSGVVISCFNEICIGNNVKIGGNSAIFDGNFHLDDPRSGKPLPIIIGDNVWIGYNSIILKGVTIGENSVIGAGSIVTKDIPANCVAAGNPCRIIRTLNIEK